MEIFPYLTLIYTHKKPTAGTWKYPEKEEEKHLDPNHQSFSGAFQPFRFRRMFNSISSKLCVAQQLQTTEMLHLLVSVDITSRVVIGLLAKWCWVAPDLVLETGSFTAAAPSMHHFKVDTKKSPEACLWNYKKTKKKPSRSHSPPEIAVDFDHWKPTFWGGIIGCSNLSPRKKTKKTTESPWLVGQLREIAHCQTQRRLANESHTLVYRIFGYRIPGTFYFVKACDDLIFFHNFEEICFR